MEKILLILFLFIMIGLCVSGIIPRKDGTVHTCSKPGCIIHVKKQKFRYTRWVMLNMLIIALLATILWLVLHEKTAADSPDAGHIIAIILYSLLCNLFLNALLGFMHVLKQLITQKKERTRITYGKLALFASGTIFLGRYVLSLLSTLLNG